jgi:hypothetical protein
MEEVSVITRVLAAVFVLAAAGIGTSAAANAATNAGAAERQNGSDPNTPEDRKDDGTRRGSRVVKLRQGSLLRRDKPLERTPDLRGEFERRRDAEVVRHYTRVAQLDAIEAVARQQSDERLLERVEAVRRKETRRFWDAMQYLRAEARRKTASGTP